MPDATLDGQQLPTATPVDRSDQRPPHIGHVIVIALIVGVFAALWLVTYDEINNAIWHSGFVAANRWALPVGVLFFSLLVGLVQKYLHAANMIKGGADEALKAEELTTYKTFWGTLLSSFFSLFSGASVGPEGALGFLSVQVSQWLAAKLHFTREGALGVALAGMSSAYNGVIGEPVFATVMASEVSGGGKGGFAFIGTNLAAGAVGYLVFALLGIPAFAGILNVGAPTTITLGWVAWALALGVIGMLLAIYIALAVRGIGRVMAAFGDRTILRILIAAIIIAAVCYFLPELMFSGESSIHDIIASPAQYGVGMLLLMAVLKPLLLALSLKSGYLGGPIFPALFTAVMVGLAISLVVPGVPLSILVACLEVSVVTLLLRAPLTAILLVSVVTGAGASANLLGLVTVSAAASLGLGLLLQKRLARRAAQAPPIGTTSPAAE